MERKTAAAVDRVAAVLLAKSAVPLQAVAAWAVVLAIQVPHPSARAVKIAVAPAKAVDRADHRSDVRNEVRRAPLRIEAAPATPLSAAQTGHRLVLRAQVRTAVVPEIQVSVDLTGHRLVPRDQARTVVDPAIQVLVAQTGHRRVPRAQARTGVVPAAPWDDPIARRVDPDSPAQTLDRLADLAEILDGVDQVPGM